MEDKMIRTSRLTIPALLFAGIAIALLPSPASAQTLPCTFDCPTDPGGPGPGPGPGPDPHDGGDSSSTSTVPDPVKNLAKKRAIEELSVNCEIKDPGATTRNMWLINTGDDALGNGQTIRFSIPSTGDRGAFRLTKPLLPNARILIPGLLATETVIGEACDVYILAH
jgi:hypothetical protein